MAERQHQPREHRRAGQGRQRPADRLGQLRRRIAQQRRGGDEQRRLLVELQARNIGATVHDPQQRHRPRDGPVRRGLVRAGLRVEPLEQRRGAACILLRPEPRVAAHRRLDGRPQLVHDRPRREHLGRDRPQPHGVVAPAIDRDVQRRVGVGERLRIGARERRGSLLQHRPVILRGDRDDRGRPEQAAADLRDAEHHRAAGE